MERPRGRKTWWEPVTGLAKTGRQGLGMERMGQSHEVFRRQEKQHVVINRIFRTGRGRFVASGAITQ